MKSEICQISWMKSAGFAKWAKILWIYFLCVTIKIYVKLLSNYFYVLFADEKVGFFFLKYQFQLRPWCPPVCLRVLIILPKRTTHNKT